jgi:hypothetical protein
MRGPALLVFSTLWMSAALITTAPAQETPASAPPAESAHAQENNSAVEGVVVSSTATTVVVQTDDNAYHLFTYSSDKVSRAAVRPGNRVRVSSGSADAHGTRVADNVTVLQAAAAGPSRARGRKAAAAPGPPVNKTSLDLEEEARRFHLGGKIGFGFSPELFMFGPQAQFGPFFSSRMFFRPNVEFGFGEVTAMYAVNAEGAYLFNRTASGWRPYFGVGPSFNFVNRSASNGSISFSNFTYKTGFNVFVGTQKRHTFVEAKTSLWSGNAPVLRLFIGYNF